MHEVFSNITGSKKPMMQFQIVSCMISKIKKKDTRVNYNKDSIIQACNFFKKRLQDRCFPVINAKI